MVRKKKDEKDEKKFRTALFFDQAEYNQLKKLSEITGAPTAELVRRAVKMYCEHRRDEIEAGEVK